MRKVVHAKPSAGPMPAQAGEAGQATAGPPAESVLQTALGDLRRSAGWRSLLLVMLLVWMAFQWGFGNDVLLPTIVATAFDAVDDGETWSAGFAAVGVGTLAGFAFWATSQLLDSVIVLSGLRLIPGITFRLSRFLQRKGWATAYADMKWSTRWIIAYGTGASVLCLVDVFATGTSGLKGRRHIVFSATLLSAGSLAAVVALVLTAAMIATRVPATESGAEVFIRFAKNPLTWITIFVTVFVVERWRGSSDDTEASEPSAESAET